ncbi:NADPH-dependent 2,4-dienoyl-CoA reductase [Thiotrichales bacterium 19S9-12]|nr:NADPH-dependent 2,4-dienoyl-CoA reductase [Thiotrichales bacterium 19S9-11]MCF6811130.1 NADPH-dependent 2,4-dienoyl-CoA reductase [Thiotrichales bacterium 19S9-12]
MTVETTYLNQPLDLGFTQLKNRIIMGSMHTGLEEDKSLYRLAKFYEERAKGGVGLIVTGGISPSRRGWLIPFGAKLTTKKEAKKHQVITDCVHEHGSKILLQILHAGRYGYHPLIVAPSKIKAPISPFTPRALTRFGINRIIKQFARSAYLAQQAGYDGVEVMGSEGYLINQFLVSRTNQRDDQFGGNFNHRMRIAVEIIKAIRATCGNNFIIMFRLSMLDLVENGSSWEEVVELAKTLEANGVTIINTGIGWHEARIPTIATMVPRAAFTPITKKLKPYVSTPLVATNRINDPDVIEYVLKEEHCDLISMARPFLADAQFVNKAINHKKETINTCIGCNQACLDHVFAKKEASCLVNPLACHETELKVEKADNPKNIAVVGAGPAGCAFAITAAERGHKITLFEKNNSIGGQFNLASEIPAKVEFKETLRYFSTQIERFNINLKTNTAVTSSMLLDGNFDEIIIASGVKPRIPQLEGVSHPKVATYMEILTKQKVPGKKVAIMGAGGIGVDVADYLSYNHVDSKDHLSAFYKEWGIDINANHRGGLMTPQISPSPYELHLLQRKKERIGKRLGKTTGWIHRMNLKNKGIKLYSGVTYKKIDDQGLHIHIDEKDQCLDVDTIILCTGQLSVNELYDELKDKVSAHIIGGAELANELDAKRVIDQAVRLAISL